MPGRADSVSGVFDEVPAGDDPVSGRIDLVSDDSENPVSDVRRKAAGILDGRGALPGPGCPLSIVRGGKTVNEFA